MKWFKHFTDAHDSQDLTKVRIKYGAEGYAVYWYCLELIAGELGTSDEINFELKHDAEVIGFNLKIDRIKVEEIMSYMISLELFEQSMDKVTCLKLAKYLDKKLTRNKKIHDIVDTHKLLKEVSGTFRDGKPTIPDESGQNPLDTDTDTDKQITTSEPTVTSQRLNKITKQHHEKIIALYHEILPELSTVLVSRWHGSKNAKALAARWNESAKFRNEKFWRAFFESVRLNPWWMRVPDEKTGQSWSGCNLAWLVKRENFDKVLDIGVNNL